MGDANLGKYRSINIGDIPVGVELSFTAEDVDGAYKKAVAAGAVPFKDLEEKPWGQTVAYVRTPEGSIIEIGTPIGE
jgi:uncharacterized glyoxalase superfamily protein PhnB